MTENIIRLYFNVCMFIDCNINYKNIPITYISYGTVNIIRRG